MKSFKWIMIVLAVIMTAALTISVGIMERGDKGSISATEINSIVHTVKTNRSSLESLTQSDIGHEFILFGVGDEPVARQNEKMLTDIDSPEKAAATGCICIPVEDNGHYICTLVLPDQNAEHISAMKRGILISGAVIMAAMLLCAVIFRLYVELAVIRPFRRMESFAERIAKGDLDIPLKRDRDNIFGAFTSSFDIMREELKAAQKRENELKRRKQELIASLSHDLKTPITGIKLICELLSVKVTDGYASEKIRNIHAKAEEMNVLVSDLLASELDDMGEMKVECRDEVSSLLSELIKLHDPQSLVSCTEIPECMISVDRSRLSQVIGNILGNSYKYAGTPITARFRINERYLEMSVKDSGSGVTEEELPLLTSKFYRGESGKRSGKEGSGLGLYIASQLMEKMNGELICSSDGAGLTVTLLMPLS